MKNINLVLCILNILIPVLYTLKKSFGKDGVRINHYFCFSFGFIYYWVIPILIGLLGLDFNDETMKSWLAIFNQIVPSQLLFYLIECLVLYLSFVFGSELKYYFKCPFKKLSVNYEYKSIYVYMVMTLPLAGLLIFVCRNSLFKGYVDMSMLTRGIAGVFSALLLLVSALLLLVVTGKRSLKNRTGFCNIWFFYYCLLALLLLSLGGRMYIVTTIIAFCVYLSVYIKPWNYRKGILIGIIGIAAMGFIGTIRLGFQGNVFSYFYNILQEPLYTSFSLVYHLSNSKINLFCFPVAFISSFINLIPSIILPNKANLIVTAADLGYVIYQPLGATHSFVEFNINLGFIGSFIFVFFLSYFIKLLSKNKNRLAIVIYSLISGCLMFTYYRDPFSISIIKNIIEFSILIPFIVVLISKKSRQIKL